MYYENFISINAELTTCNQIPSGKMSNLCNRQLFHSATFTTRLLFRHSNPTKFPVFSPKGLAVKKHAGSKLYINLLLTLKHLIDR